MTIKVMEIKSNELKLTHKEIFKQLVCSDSTINDIEMIIKWKVLIMEKNTKRKVPK